MGHSAGRSSVGGKGAVVAGGLLLALGWASGTGLERFRSDEASLRAENARLRAELEVVPMPGPTKVGAAEITRLERERAQLQSRVEEREAAASRSVSLAMDQRLEKAEELLASVTGDQDADKLNRAVGLLVQGGVAAVPVIDRWLAGGKDVLLDPDGEAEPVYGSFPTLRVGLLQALKRIGGEEAKRVGLQHLPDSRNTLEVYEIGQILGQEGEPVQAHRAVFLAALQNVYDGPRARQVREARKTLWAQYLQEQELALAADDPAALEACEDRYDECAIAQDKEAAALRFSDRTLGCDMAAGLGAIRDLAPAMEAYADGAFSPEIVNTLATGLPADQALESLQRICEVRKQDRQDYHEVLAGMGVINSDQAFQHLARLYPELSDTYRWQLMLGVTYGLQPQALERKDPFATRGQDRQRGRRPTLEMGQRALRFLEALREGTPKGKAATYLEHLIPSLKQQLEEDPEDFTTFGLE